jgi:hypothetical protein
LKKINWKDKSKNLKGHQHGVQQLRKKKSVSFGVEALARLVVLLGTMHHWATQSLPSAQ